jgi:hypothetical protein
MKLSDLNPNPLNPRTVTKEKLGALKKSLKRAGSLDGIIWDRKKQVLWGGHQRVKILPPDSEIVITHRFDEPTAMGTVANGYVLFEGERITYREVEFDDETGEAALIAANKNAGSWDFPKLSEQFLNIDSKNWDLSYTMFDTKEITDFLAPTAPPKEVSEARMPESYRIEIEFDSEEEQAAAFEALQKTGYKIKIVNI